MKPEENHGTTDQMKRLLHFSSTVNDNDSDSEASALVFNNEGNEESTTTIEALHPKESAKGLNLDPNVRTVNQVTDYLAYSNDRWVQISLLKILNDFGAPLYAFSSVIGWAENAYQTGYRFNPRTKHFNTMMKELQEWTQL